MEIVVNKDSTISIFGSIKTEKSYSELKEFMLDKIENGAKSFDFNLKNCYDLNSRILGFFLKLIEKDSITITIKSKSEEIHNILRNLALLETFNIKKMEL